MHVKVQSLHAGSKWTPSKTLCAKAPRKGLDNEGSAKASITTPYSYVLRDASLRPIQDSGTTVKNLLYVQKPCKQLGARNESFYEPPKVEVNRCDRFGFNTAEKLVVTDVSICSTLAHPLYSTFTAFYSCISSASGSTFVVGSNGSHFVWPPTPTGSTMGGGHTPMKAAGL